MKYHYCVFIILPLVLLMLASAPLQAQHTQTIRGQIIDRETRQALPGANVILLDSEPFRGTTADNDGRFRLEGVRVGRQSIKVTFLGYEDVVLHELEVISAKELVLNIEMQEKVFTSKEVVITASQGNESNINEMNIISTRVFSVEETSKYAGAWGDPARMASNFAGVTIVSDKRNDIIVRGNSPIGVLWRMEGLPIPNPNHFAIAGSSGGAISMINNNLLDNSDFLSGAFPAEYGNALASVFDLRMRNGNNEKYEFLFQIGMQGVEAGAEGPFIKGKTSSFLLNYRYSTLTLLNLVGIRIVDAIPNFQDISLKINFPYKKGNISLFGIGGKSMAVEKPEKDSLAWEGRNDRIGYQSGSQMAVAGINWFHNVGKTTYMKLALSSSVFNPLNSEDSIGDDYTMLELSRYTQTEMRSILSLLFNTKLNSRHILRYGTSGTMLQSWNGSYYFTYTAGPLKNIVNESNFTISWMQAFFQWKYNIRENISLTSGAHFMHLLLNGKTALEPRAALRFGIGANHALSIGFGMHSLIQPAAVYFAEVPADNGETETPNKSLGFTQAIHYVAAYDWMLTENLHLKLEAYYQGLSSVPLDPERPEYSLLNFGTDDNIFIQSRFVNDGLGRNFGLELTAEKFFSKGSYFLVTASLFESEYRDFNNIWRNTRYNSNYSVNVLAGKEFKTGKKKNSTIGIHATAVYIGGQRYTPIDLPASQSAGFAVFNDSLAYSLRMKNFFKIDLRFRFRFNSRRLSHELALEAANILNRKNIEGVWYNRNTGELDYHYGLSLIPLVFYRLVF